jgi:hypothetical protein
MNDETAFGNNPMPDEPRMTLLAVGGAYWLYEGDELLHDLLFQEGQYPFRVLCVSFTDDIEVRRVCGTDFHVSSLWRVNDDVVLRLRRQNLLIEITSERIGPPAGSES